MIDLGLKQKEVLFENTEKELLSAFYASSTGKSNKEFRFAKVDSNFVRFLPYLNDGAVKLYLYYAVVAKNDTGESWHSIDTISQKLDATARSIGNWNRQLEDLGLIFRTSNGKKSKTTFVLPLTGFTVKMSTQKIDQVLTELLVTDSETQEIHIDDSFAEGYATDAKLSAYLAAQEIDLLITNETHFQELAKTGCFEDLNNVIPEIDSQNKDLFCWSSVSADSDSEHTGAYGIDITDSEFLKNSWYSEEKAIIGIIQGSMKKENAILTLSELFFND